MTARPGEVLALLGANGSGKSSLLRALAQVQAHSGTIAWDGAAAPAGSVGYMPQDNAARVALTAFEVVLLGRMRSLALRVGSRDLQAAQSAMEEIGVADLASRRIGELSGGQRQMVLMAQVLAAGPRVLLLDEPTSALDIAHQLHVLDLLRTATRQRGLTTIAVLHDLNAAARSADRAADKEAAAKAAFDREAFGSRARGTIPIGEVQWRNRVRVAGRVRSVRVQPRAGTSNLECVLVDDTGKLLLVFQGRRRIPGIQPGARLVVEGMVGDWARRQAILNPDYELIAGPDARVEPT